MTIGSAPITPAADIDAQSVSMRPISVAVPRGIVMARGVAVRTNANMNSLKVTITAKIAVATKPGAASGSVMRRNAENRG